MVVFMDGGSAFLKVHVTEDKLKSTLRTYLFQHHVDARYYWQGHLLRGMCKMTHECLMVSILNETDVCIAEAPLCLRYTPATAPLLVAEFAALSASDQQTVMQQMPPSFQARYQNWVNHRTSDNPSMLVDSNEVFLLVSAVRYPELYVEYMEQDSNDARYYFNDTLFLVSFCFLFALWFFGLFNPLLIVLIMCEQGECVGNERTGYALFGVTDLTKNEELAPPEGIEVTKAPLYLRYNLTTAPILRGEFEALSVAEKKVVMQTVPSEMRQREIAWRASVNRTVGLPSDGNAIAFGIHNVSRGELKRTYTDNIFDP